MEVAMNVVYLSFQSVDGIRGLGPFQAQTESS